MMKAVNSRHYASGLGGGMISAAALMMLPSAARLGAEMPKQRIAPPFPRIAHESGHYEVLRGDFHMHSTHSDGHLAPPDRAHEA